MPFITKTVTLVGSGTAEIKTEGVSEKVLVSVEKVNRSGSVLYFVGGLLEAGSSGETVEIAPTSDDTVVTEVKNYPVIKCTQAQSGSVIFKVSERISDTDD